MTKCAERICYVKDMCDLFEECTLKHRLLNDNKKYIYSCLRAEVPAKREKMIISFMSEKEKMKVRGYRVGSYYKWKGLTGIDPDKSPVIKKKKHKNQPKKKSTPKVKRQKVGVTMKEISKEVFNAVSKKSIPIMNRRPMSADEYYEKIKKSVGIMDKWRNEPEPNFHESF